MKTIKAEPVTSTAIVNNLRVGGLATNLEDRDDYPHFIPFTDIKGDTITSKTKHYVEMISKNHPEYNFIPEEEEITIMTPKVEQSVHPHKEEMEAAFGVDEVEFETLGTKIVDELRQAPTPLENVDQETGEIHEPSPQVNNPLKTETMENQTEVPTPEAVTDKLSFGQKSKWVAKVGVATSVRVVTLPTHVALQSASDMLGAMARGVRNTEAWTIDKLNLSDKTRAEIKGRIDQRTRNIEQVGLNIIVSPVMLPVRLVKGIQLTSKLAREAREQQAQTQTA